MKSNELCQKLRLSVKQFSKICQHLGITFSEGNDRVFTPREIQRLQYFVAKKRSAAKKKETTKTTAATATVAGTALNSLITEVAPLRSNSEQVPTPIKTQVPAQPEPVLSPVKAAANLPTTESASVGLRACAYIIDCLCTLILGPLILIPILGQMLIGMLLFFYWLLRDVGGASPGKLILGLQVVNQSGDPFRVGPRIVRNILLSIAPLLFCIPVVGIFIGIPVALLVILVETVMLCVTGNRIGDLLGGTLVKLVPKFRLASE